MLSALIPRVKQDVFKEIEDRDFILSSGFWKALSLVLMNYHPFPRKKKGRDGRIGINQFEQLRTERRIYVEHLRMNCLVIKTRTDQNASFTAE